MGLAGLVSMHFQFQLIMGWTGGSRRGSAWTSKVRVLVWALRQGVLRPLDHQTEEKLPSQGLQKLSRRPTHGSGPLDKVFSPI